MLAIRMRAVISFAKRSVVAPRVATKGAGLVRCFHGASFLRQPSEDDEPADNIEQAIKHGFTTTKVTNTLKKDINSTEKKDSDETKQTIFDTEKQMFQVRRQMTAAYSLGEYKMALDYAETLLSMAEKLMGKRNAVYASCLNNVALMLKALGEQEKAMEKYVAALHVYVDIAGQNNTSYASALANIGVLYKEMSKGRLVRRDETNLEEEPVFVPVQGLEKLALLDRAEEALVEARTTRISLLGAAHKDSLYSSMHLASLLKMQDKPAEALAMLTEALAVAEDKYGKMELIVASLHNDLGVLHKSQQRYDQALVHYNQALSVRSNILGDAHNDTIVCTYNLAELYSAMGQEERAIALQEQVVKTLEGRMGGGSGDGGGSGEVVVESVKNSTTSTSSGTSDANPKILEYTHKSTTTTTNTTSTTTTTTTTEPPSPIHTTEDKPNIQEMVARHQQSYTSTNTDSEEERRRKLLAQTMATRPHKPSTRRGAKKTEA